MWGAIGAIGGAIAGSLINASSAKNENSKNRKFALAQMDKEAELNKDYAKWSATELPKLNRQGMTDAGFNPLLAINSGTGTQGSVSGSSPSISVPQLDVGAISSALGNVTDVKQKERMIDNQEHLQEAQIDSLEHSNAKSDADAALARSQALLANAQTDYTKVQTDMHGMTSPLGVVSRFGRDVVAPVAKTFGPRAWDAINRAGSAIGHKVVNSAKSFWHSLSSRPVGDVPKDPTSGMSPAQKSEYLKAGPHNRPHAPYKSYKVHGHW